MIRVDEQAIDDVLVIPGVKVVDTKLNVNGLNWLLETCTKLKKLNLLCHSNAEDITTEVEKEQIRTVVAEKSFKQSFGVSFESDFCSHRIKVKLGQQLV